MRGDLEENYWRSNKNYASNRVISKLIVPALLLQMDRWYEPPVSFDELARIYRAAVHHSSLIAVKRNVLTRIFIPHPLLSQQAFSHFVQDYKVFDNACLEKRTNRLGRILSLEPSLAQYPRRSQAIRHHHAAI